ncbi:MAG: glycine dehydrogenase, partial [Bacteriovoracales bacterium]|nr:glycine dehydrogenase [Bacteriovoracales bacterium]
MPSTPPPPLKELAPHYIRIEEGDRKAMLTDLGLDRLDDVFSHIDDSLQFSKAPDIGPELSYREVMNTMEEIASQNCPRPSFIGDGLKSYSIPGICAKVAEIRGLSTAYTPYQPERSQGTLMSLWIYASALSKLTGLEAVNASLYDRATCLFEAIATAKRMGQGEGPALICGPLYPGDREVLTTLAQETSLSFVFLPHDGRTGRCGPKAFEKLLIQEKPFAVVFSQVNALGILEDVDVLTDLTHKAKALALALIDPVHLCSRGLKPPSEFGQEGADIIVAEGQHLCLAPNFGGPGLGVFGMRFPGRQKGAIRSAPGRLVGEGKDRRGRPCKSIVLSTREQHIRREKATSNICSNQSFVATMAGAALLAKGDEGLNDSLTLSRTRALEAFERLGRLEGLSPTYPESPFWNEWVLDLGRDCDEVIEKARLQGLHLGVNVSKRVGDGRNHHLMVFFNDIQTQEDMTAFFQFFETHFDSSPSERSGHSGPKAWPIPKNLLRKGSVELPRYGEEKLLDYYQKLGEQNVSPDQAVYPLGSCTMKYNPLLNDYAA